MLSFAGDAINNADLSESFQIRRNPGAFALGGWQGAAPQVIQAYGTVSVAGQKELDMLPEGDRIRETRIFNSSTAMYPTDAALGITADVLAYGGELYSVVATIPQSRRGYHTALAVRMEGD